MMAPPAARAAMPANFNISLPEREQSVVSVTARQFRRCARAKQAKARYVSANAANSRTASRMAARTAEIGANFRSRLSGAREPAADNKRRRRQRQQTDIDTRDRP